MRIAVMGAGSLGTILGAYIAKAGHDVTLIDAYKDHVDALNKNGAHIIGSVDFVQPVKAITPDQMEGVYDLIFYMAKQTYNDTAIPQIAAHIDENSTVCTCQNGIPEYAVSEVIGSERVVGAPVNWAGAFQGPGVSLLVTDPSILNYSLGSLDGPVNNRVLLAKKYLECMGNVHISENLIGLRWTKLLMNATFSGLSTALGTTFGGILENDIWMYLLLRAGKECLDVAAEKGITLELYEQYDKTYDFYNTFRKGSKETNAKSFAEIREIWTPHAACVASMAQDLLKGRKCEIEQINGVVCKAGRETNFPTPVNDRIVEIVKGIQEGKYQYDTANIQYFQDLL